MDASASRPRQLAQHRGDLIGVLDHGAAAPGAAGGPWGRTGADGLDQELAPDRDRAGRRVAGRQGADRFGGRRPEQVLFGRPDQVGGPALGRVEAATPRTSATGTRASLPITRPLAAATSSARATTVASRDRRGRRAGHGGRRSRAAPAQPIATLTRPVRQARPNVSVMTTPSRAPGVSPSPSRRRSAVASGSSGSSASVPVLHVRRVDARVRAHEPVSGLGDHQVAPPGDHPRGLGLDRRPLDRSPGTNRPSAFDTIFEVTTTTSSSRAPGRQRASATRCATRSSPGPTSGSPSTPMISSARSVLTSPATSARPGPRPRRRRRPP